MKTLNGVDLSFIKEIYPDYSVLINYKTPSFQEGENKITNGLITVGCIYDEERFVQQYFIVDKRSSYPLSEAIKLLYCKIQNEIIKSQLNKKCK